MPLVMFHLLLSLTIGQQKLSELGKSRERAEAAGDMVRGLTKAAKARRLAIWRQVGHGPVRRTLSNGRFINAP